jgi:hypothetical protein
MDSISDFHQGAKALHNYPEVLLHQPSSMHLAHKYIILIISIIPSFAWQYPIWSRIEQSDIFGKEQRNQEYSGGRRTFLHGAVHTTLLNVVLSTGTQPVHASNLPESTGADISKTGQLETLIPVVALRSSLVQLKAQLSTNRNGSLKINLDDYAVPRDEMLFKRIFDSYSDPVSYKQKFLDQNAFLVYYSKGFDGPGRDNIESDINERQTQQFGLRNDAWIAWENFLIELKFVNDDDNDCIKYIVSAIQAVDSYLSLAPQADLVAAKKRIGATW